MKRIAILLTMMFLMAATFTVASAETSAAEAATSAAKAKVPPSDIQRLKDAQKARAAAAKAYNQARVANVKAQNAKNAADRLVARLQKQYDKKHSEKLLAKLNAAKVKQQSANAVFAVTQPKFDSAKTVFSAAKMTVQDIKDYIRCVRRGKVSCA